MSKTKRPLINDRAVQIQLITDKTTKEPTIVVKVGLFTEIGLSLEAASALEAALAKFRAVYLEEHAERVTKAQQATAARGK